MHLEIEMMKERFSKLLLGEDMSGCGNGVSTALAISNAVTNLYGELFDPLYYCRSVKLLIHCLGCCDDLFWYFGLIPLATLFGQVWRLEPLQPEKKFMWRREMHCLLSVSDHIVALIPSWQTFPDGSKLEVSMSFLLLRHNLEF